MMLAESESALFAGLGATERQSLEERLRPRQFPAGVTILQQGQWSGALHIIRRGAVSVVASDSLGNRRALARLGPGEFVGEMSVLTGRAPSATVTALVPTETLALDHDDFVAVLGSSPRLAQNVLRVLSERLQRTNRRQVSEEQATTVAVLSPFDRDAGPALALNLAVSLARQTRGRVLLAVDAATLVGPLRPLAGAVLPPLDTLAGDPGALAAHRAARPGHPALRSVQVCAFRPTEDGPATIPSGTRRAAIDALAEVYRYIVLAPSPGTDGVAEVAGATRALALVPAGRLRDAAVGQAVAALQGAGLQVGLVATDLRHAPTVGELAALGQGAAAPVPRAMPAPLASLGAELLPPLVRRDRRGAVAATIDWLARDLAGLKVGLALGAGSARGFAHIGVLRVLEREGVPVDALAGTSVGAFVGGFWSCGLALDAVATALERAASRPFGVTLPRVSLFSNRWIQAHTRLVVGSRRIEDLARPFAAVAVDLLTHEPVALHRGPLWRALIASGSIPGVYPPVAHDGRLLVDGMVRTPVPTGVVADLGGDVTIGVRLAPVPEGPGATVRPAAPARPNIVDIVFTMLDVMQEAIESLGSERADLMIHPQVTKVTLRHFAEGRALIAAGEAAAEEALPALRRLLPLADHE